MRRFLVTLSVFIAVSGSQAVFAAVRTVGHSGAENHSTITAALQAAQPGDEIRVRAGTYDASRGETFPLALKSGVALLGASPQSTTISAPPGVQAFVNAGQPLSSATRLSGFHVTRAVPHSSLALMELTATGTTMAPVIAGNVFTSGGERIGLGLVIQSGRANGNFDGTIANNRFSGFGEIERDELWWPDVPAVDAKGAIVLRFVPGAAQKSRSIHADVASPGEAQLSPAIEGNTFSDNGSGITLCGNAHPDPAQWQSAIGVISPTVSGNAFSENRADVVLLEFGSVSGARIFAVELIANRSFHSGSFVVSYLEPVIYDVPDFQSGLTAKQPIYAKQAVQDAVQKDTLIDVRIADNVIVGAESGGVLLVHDLTSNGNIALSYEVTGNSVTVAESSSQAIGIAVAAVIHEIEDTTTDSVRIENNTIQGYARGLYVWLETAGFTSPYPVQLPPIAWPPPVHDVQIVGNRLQNNDIGLWLFVPFYSELSTLVSCNLFDGNRIGSLIPAENFIPPDFGGGERSSPGNNVFRNSGEYHLATLYLTIPAENNDWGTTSSAEIQSKIHASSLGLLQPTVDFEPFLSSPPACAAPIAVGGMADLNVVKSVAGGGPSTIGAPITFQLQVTNTGPASATDVVITDVLPAQLQFVSASPGCTHQAGTVDCTIASLANGAMATRTITVTASQQGSFTNTASVTGDQDDPTPVNDSTAPVIVGPAIAAEVPTASGWGLLLMSVMLALAGVWFTRRS